MTAEQLIDKMVNEGKEADEYKKLDKMSLTALQGVWRKRDIGPTSDRPKDKEGLIDDIMSDMYGEDWQAKAF